MAKRRSGSANFKVKGLDDLLENLGGLSKNTYSIMKASLYPGAGILADEVKRRCPDPELAAHIDIARMATNGGNVDTAVMFTGYDSSHTTSQFPKGIPWAMKAAIYESGTSDRFTKHGNLYRGGITKKHRFLRPALFATKKKVEEAMREELTERITKSMEG